MPRPSRSRRIHFESLESRAMLNGEPVAQFSLVDVNESSATAGKSVSPSDYLGQTSGWYFGHST